ncbi:hypothetical protein COXBURSA334_1539 [Coxiella burnetii Q321]|nr:hypothetical protein COXBURSA334_1539 [Coxiella burnetii Q321]
MPKHWKKYLMNKKRILRAVLQLESIYPANKSTTQKLNKP